MKLNVHLDVNPLTDSYTEAKLNTFFLALDKTLGATIIKYKFRFILFCYLFSYMAMVSSAEVVNFEKELNIPDWIKENFNNSNFVDDYYYYFERNPVYIRGDFDGDTQPDIAIMVANKHTKKIGIIVFHYGDSKSYILGAGKEIGDGGDDFGWLTNWSVQRNILISQGATEDKPPQTKGEVIFVEKVESASAILYFDGVSYNWYQQGD
jgi:hypothetical protein